MPRAARPHSGAAVLLALAALGGGCTQDPADSLEIDLAAPPHCRVAGEAATVAVTSAAEPALVQADARPIDCVLRLPSASALLFELPRSVDSAAAAVTIAGDSSEQALEPVRDDDGSWRAELSGFDDQLVRLRFENRSGAPLTRGRPRIAGREALAGPALPPPPGERDAEPPNVLLYVVGALRADRLSIHGYAQPTTPRLDELARRGAVFESAYTTSWDTARVISSLFASIHPWQEGALGSQAGGTPHTLAQSFRRSGYMTAAFQANPALNESTPIARGFDSYAVAREPRGGAGGVRAEALHAEVFQWLSASPREPFFLYVQSLDALDSYDPAAQPPQYDRAVAYADREIGALINALADLELRENTIIAVTAARGEARQSGDPGRDASAREARLRVPLLFALPWQDAPLRVGEVVSLIDVGPTLLDLAGIAPPGQFRGRSLVRPRARHLPRAAAAEFAEAAWFAREGPWKLAVEPGGARLVREAEDPSGDLSEQHPVAASYLARLIPDAAVPAP